MVKYSKDGKCAFDSERHTYTVNGKRLQGVTGLIAKYKNKFDSETIATAYAKKHGLNKDDVLASWELKGRESRECGTRVHKVFEDYIEKGVININSERRQFQAAKFIREIFLSGRLNPVSAEEVVYNKNIASQIDCIAEKDGKLFILDWKTNEKIEDQAFGNKTMLPPFGLIPDCSFYHYSIQLSFYERLYGKPIAGSFIVHITDNWYNIIPSEKIDIPVKLL